MGHDRRDFLRLGTLAAASGVPFPAFPQGHGGDRAFLNVRQFGAKGDGTSVDSGAINAAIDAAAAGAGGTVYFPAGTYASYSIRLKSNVALYLEQGATVLAAPVPYEGITSGGYDTAEPQGDWEPYQDFGHNHWHNSLMWGENLHGVSILGPGLIHGKGLSRGHNERTLPNVTAPGVANKAIALKNCRNVILRDFSLLQGGCSDSGHRRGQSHHRQPEN